jgi:Flp pilus assembly pilin Flp
MMLQAYTYLRVAAGELRSKMHERFTELAGNESGATAAEYALLVTLIAIVIIVGAFALGTSVNDRLQQTGDCVATTSGLPC